MKWIDPIEGFHLKSANTQLYFKKRIIKSLTEWKCDQIAEKFQKKTTFAKLCFAEKAAADLNQNFS